MNFLTPENSWTTVYVHILYQHIHKLSHTHAYTSIIIHSQDHTLSTCYDLTPSAKSLGHIRTVTDTVTGLPKYTLDPFCPSNMEFQRRGEDEVAKFFHKVIEFASEQKDLQLNYEDPESRKVSQNPTRVIGVWSLDFRWQMKHLLYNRSKYSSHVFNGLVSESYIMQRCRQLKDQADEMAHKQHLMDNLRQKGVKDGAGLKEEEQVRGEGTKQRRSSGTRRYIQQFFETAIEFTEEIERSTRHKPLKVQYTLQTLMQQTFETLYKGEFCKP